MNSREKAIKIFRSALVAVYPEVIVKEYAKSISSNLKQENFKDIIVVGFGKAAFQMACTIEDVIGVDRITAGIVVTKYGHAESNGSSLKKIKVFEAAHPIPDDNGIKATEKIIELLKSAGSETLVLCLISGGGSALLVSPMDGISLSEKQEITDLLLRAGADIEELNAVRKHLSKVKGGRLAEIASPAKLISIIISDVIGDKLDVIASGPTSADSSTFNDALRVIEKYNLVEKTPQSIINIFNGGNAGKVPDTPKGDNPLFESIQNIIVGSNQKAVNAAATEARNQGFETDVISTTVSGEAREAAKWLADKSKKVLSKKRRDNVCLISGGETVVTVTGEGKGGRNMELALSFAIEIEGMKGITMISAGTDGTDGPTDAAGAIVDGQTIIKARDMGLDPSEYLNNNDSYNLFSKIDSLLITGPTGTNVMDIQIILLIE